MSENSTDLVIEGTVIGIDLGTTYSCVGIFRNKKIEIIANETSSRTLPSYISFSENEMRLIGQAAKDQIIKNPKMTIYNIKRLMGRNWDDKFVQDELKNFSFPMIEHKSKPCFQNKKGESIRHFDAEALSAMILKRLVEIAKQFTNENIKNVVITVPAYFSSAQRQATINAGKIAGLNVMKLLNEPTAAALAYGITLMEDRRMILVFDLGGGTFDVTILKIEKKEFTVRATAGNNRLGGEDFDQNVVDHFIKLYKMKYKKDCSQSNRAIQRLRKEVEKAKRALSHEISIDIVIDSFFDHSDFHETLTRAKFEELNKELFASTMEPLKQALNDAQLTKKDIDEIIMVGGSSRIPKVRQLVRDFFDGREPYQKINPDEAVAYGAALYAGMVSGQEDSAVLFDVNPLSLGIENSDKTISVIIPRNTILPVRKTQTRTTSHDYQKTAEFSIYEGELPLAKDNLFLGQFKLEKIEHALAGIPRFTTTLEIDHNGILHVSAVDEKTKENITITVDWEKNLPTKEVIDNMLKISQEYADVDKKFYESIGTRSEFREFIESLYERLDDKNLTDIQREQLEQVAEENNKWLQENKICEIDEYNERRKMIEKEIKSIEH